MRMKIVAVAIPIALLSLLAACSDVAPSAWGNANSVIVLAPENLWAEVRDTVHAALEPRIFTVRDERTFEVTHVAPGAPEWSDLRRFKQILVLGTPEDSWVSDVLDGKEVPATRPAMVERSDVWARGQRVTVVLLPHEGAADAVVQMLPELHELLDSRFRQYAIQRMFTSGAAEGFRDTLRATAGFGLLLPNVYRRTVVDSLYVFRNDQALGEQLDRTVVVTWRSGTPDSLTADALLAWREALERPDMPAQVTQRDRLEVEPIEVPGGYGIQVRGAWATPPGEFPAGGPFVDRMIVCPDQNRTYLLDAWLYVPRKGKYEYVIQMETILNSFECGGSAA